jgi:formate dehydrogenase subunit gamma
MCQENPLEDGECHVAKQKVFRWILVERIGHWAYVLLFVAALVSASAAGEGAEESASAAGNGAAIHGALGLVMVGLPLLLFLLFARRRLLDDLREVTHWDADDRLWLRKAVRGSYLLRREMPPQGRLNAGQKLATMLAGLLALGIVATGCILLFAGRGRLSEAAFETTVGIHVGFVIGAVIVLAGHVGHLVLVKGGTKYLASMFSGWLDEQTAREHHYKWWRQARSGEDGGSVTPRG